MFAKSGSVSVQSKPSAMDRWLNNNGFIFLKEIWYYLELEIQIQILRNGLWSISLLFISVK